MLTVRNISSLTKIIRTNRFKFFVQRPHLQPLVRPSTRLCRRAMPTSTAVWRPSCRRPMAGWAVRGSTRLLIPAWPCPPPPAPRGPHSSQKDMDPGEKSHINTLICLFFVFGGAEVSPFYPEIYSITPWSCCAPGSHWEMPYSNPELLPRKSGELCINFNSIADQFCRRRAG